MTPSVEDDETRPSISDGGEGPGPCRAIAESRLVLVVAVLIILGFVSRRKRGPKGKHVGEPIDRSHNNVLHYVANKKTSISKWQPAGQAVRFETGASLKQEVYIA